MSGGVRAEQAPVWGRSSLPMGRVDKSCLWEVSRGCVLCGQAQHFCSPYVFRDVIFSVAGAMDS